MTRNLKFFGLAFLISLPFWWLVNTTQQKIEDFLFLAKISENTDLITTQINQEKELEKLKPIRKTGFEDFTINAEAAISVFIPKNKEFPTKILFEKNSKKTLPIASLTKLMTAKIVLDYYDNIDTNLLYSMLISSDNTAASALAEMVFGKETFLDLMNMEAKKLGMENTHFFNATGLDPETDKNKINFSSAEDLVKLARDITINHPLIWKITTETTFENKTNTNKLLGKIPNIIGGKTGETPKAGECFLLVVSAPKNKGYIINVILNSKNRFEDMEKLIKWIEYAYKW
jgi:D-alanyl-D-alanine carboxypeptidase